MTKEAIKNLILVDLISHNPDSNWVEEILHISKEEVEEMGKLYKANADYKEMFSVIKDEDTRNKLIDLFSIL